MSQHSRFHYSVTIRTDDEAVLHCLRALSQYAQKKGNLRIPWGGTKKNDWEQHNHCVTFHFSEPEYRDSFIEETFRLLEIDLWEKVRVSDSDPATPQLK